MAEHVIRTQELTKRFDDFTAVNQVSFQVQEGEVVGYLGPNGSGKTTTIRMLLGLLLPTSGEAFVLGRDIQSQAEDIRTQVGYMSQKFALYDDLTPTENLEFYAGIYGVARKESAREVMAQVGIEGIQDELVGDLPVGWRQRLALATAIVHQPRLLFLDEPTSGVDPAARRVFWDLIYEFVEQGITAFVTTHYMDEAEYCQRVGIMQKGSLLAMDTPNQLKQEALPGLVWDLDVDALLPALELMEKTHGVQRVALTGDRLRILAEEGVTQQNLKAVLFNEGIKDAHIERAEPNLEDVFLALAT
ncbi:MAG: ABC transporter ATP-binding protein [Chloroflexi bacterium]|nr:MAG: ABC transporter ATP-binding protein [Chloroflexota bacterium]MBL1197413.1 ABC transporter ATP-binding protein [Chloroflexota bacterium]NOH14709.1 ABC transporter ATP-binding protein [Chloroflexota bacterium]